MLNKTIKNNIIKNLLINFLLIVILLGLFFGYLKYLDVSNISAIAYLGTNLLIMYSFLIIILIKLLYDSYKLNSFKFSFINSFLPLLSLIVLLSLILLIGKIRFDDVLPLVLYLLLSSFVVSFIISIIPKITKKIRIFFVKKDFNKK